MQGWTEKCCLLAGYASNGKCSCRWCTRTGVRGGLLLRHAKLLPTLKQPKTPHSHLRTVFQLSHTPAPHCTLPSLQTHSPLNCLDLLTCTTHTHTLPTTHPLEQQHSIYAMPTNNLWHTHTPGHTHTDTHTPTHPHTHTHKNTQTNYATSPPICLTMTRAGSTATSRMEPKMASRAQHDHPPESAVGPPEPHFQKLHYWRGQEWQCW